MVFQLFGVEWVMPIDGWWIFRQVVKEGSAKLFQFCLECNSFLFNAMHLDRKEGSKIQGS
jgi:hypothetical protein